MLADPLPVKVLTLGAASALTVEQTESYALIDAGAGRSVRRSTDAKINALLLPPATLTISHSVSNENKPTLTDRTLVRFDLPLLGPEGRSPKAFCYAVIGIPRGTLFAANGTSIIDNTIVGIGLTQHLIGALGVNPTANTTGVANLQRIIAGES